MDYKQFRRRLGEITGRNASDIDALTEGLAVILQETCAELNTVAIPTFGSFDGVKKLEQESVDLSTGRRMLFPPEITIEFRPAGMLNKRLNQDA